MSCRVQKVPELGWTCHDHSIAWDELDDETPTECPVANSRRVAFAAGIEAAAKVVEGAWLGEPPRILKNVAVAVRSLIPGAK